MRRKTLLFLLFLLPLWSAAQGGIEGGLYFEHFQLGYRGQTSVGGMLHVPVGDRFTLNYQANIGLYSGRGFYAHAPVGAVAGIWLLTHTRGGGLNNLVNGLGALLVIIPEGAGMYVTENRLKMHVSVNPLGFEYWRRWGGQGEETGKMSCNVVARFKMPTNLKWNIYVAPQVAGTIIYTPGEKTDRFGVKAGVTFGFDAGE